MAREPSQKLVDYGIIAGLALAGYVVWTMFFKKEAPKECPAGQHAVNPCEGQMGWPAFLCNAGRNITGAFLDCKPDVVSPTIPLIPGIVDLVCPDGKILENGVCKPVNLPPITLPKDTFGCVMQLQRWCPIDKKCMDNARSCTPDPALIPSPGACYEWSPTFHKWIYSPTMPGCVPYYEEKIVIPKCKDSECTPGDLMCVDGISKICVPLGTGCEDHGFWSNTNIDVCKPKSNIVKCSCGMVDLNNPPGTTCESACKGYTPPGACNISMWDAMRGCGQTQPGKKTCIGNQEVCNASGADIKISEGIWVNAAQLTYNNCLKAACGWW